ncbi:hypothetical protein IKF25_02065 [Candidatus Saccharibacteria bacterium]|nr:hypothetical protein [Candidatus Saccharibacteria bacterium]
MKKKLAIFISIFMAFSFSNTVFAEDQSNEVYWIRGYNEANNIIRGSDSYISDEWSFCLDYKEVPSNLNDAYTRIKLSELTSYDKAHGHANYTQIDRIRLLKIVIHREDIIEKAKTISFNTMADYYLSNYLSNYLSTYLRRKSIVDAAEEQGIYILNNSSYEEYSNLLNTHPDIMRKAFNNYVKENIRPDNAPQYLIWLIGQNEKFPAVLTDDGTTSSNKDSHYHFLAKDIFGFNLEDPFNNPGSLYNNYFRILIDYIDNELPNYFELGYDAWIYMTDTETKQNILGGAFLAQTQNPDPESTSTQQPNSSSIAVSKEQMMPENPKTDDKISHLIPIITISSLIIAIALPKLLSRR